MTRWSDDDEAETDRDEGPDPSDQDDDPDDNTVPCPSCRTPIYEESEFCPHCGQYVTREEQPVKTSTWVIIGVVLAVVAAAVWMR